MESLFIQMMDKSQFLKIDPYDWFCGPGSHVYNTFQFCHCSMNCICDHQENTYLVFLFRGGVLINAELIIRICIVCYMSDTTDIHSARKLQNCSDYVAQQIIILAI